MAAAGGSLLLLAPPPPSPAAAAAARRELPVASLSRRRIPSARRPTAGSRQKRDLSAHLGAASMCSTARAESSSSAASREPMTPPYNVLITGSTKGIGYALAKEFLKAGDNVVICSRSVERVESAVRDLRQEFGEQHVVQNAMSVKAIKMMLSQPRGGHIFNMDGAGADGRPTPRFAAYGATKRSVVHLTKSLQAELQMQDVKNVLVHNLSPGMVTTDLLMCGVTTNQAKFFINVLAEPAEVVAKYLVPNIRLVPTNGSQKPTYIRFLTGIKAYTQIFSRIAFGARRNRYILED